MSERQSGERWWVEPGVDGFMKVTTDGVTSVGSVTEACEALNTLESELETLRRERDRLRGFDAAILALGSRVWMYAEEEHKRRCPNRDEFNFLGCPYFACAAARADAQIAQQFHEALTPEPDQVQG